MFCVKCGKAVSYGQTFCEACGNTVTTDDTSTTVELCSQSTLSESSAKPRLWVILFGVLLCMTCIGLVVGIPLIITETKHQPAGTPRRNKGWLVAGGALIVLVIITITMAFIGSHRTSGTATSSTVISNQIPSDPRDQALMWCGSWSGPVKPYIPDPYLKTIGYNYEQVLKCLGKPSAVIGPDVREESLVGLDVVRHFNYKEWDYTLSMSPAPFAFCYSLLFDLKTKRVYQVNTVLPIGSVKPIDFLPSYLMTRDPEAIYCDGCYTPTLSVIWHLDGVMYFIEVTEDKECLRSTVKEVDSKTGDMKVTHPLNGDAWKRGRLVDFVASTHDISDKIKSRRIRFK